MTETGKNVAWAKGQLPLFERRCRLLAEQVKMGLLPFVWAVDCAYDAAIYCGLADGAGDDAVQQVMARAFMQLHLTDEA